MPETASTTGTLESASSPDSSAMTGPNCSWELSICFTAASRGPPSESEMGAPAGRSTPSSLRASALAKLIRPSRSSTTSPSCMEASTWSATSWAATRCRESAPARKATMNSAPDCARWKAAALQNSEMESRRAGAAGYRQKCLSSSPDERQTTARLAAAIAIRPERTVPAAIIQAKSSGMKGLSGPPVR